MEQFVQCFVAICQTNRVAPGLAHFLHTGHEVVQPADLALEQVLMMCLNLRSTTSMLYCQPVFLVYFKYFFHSFVMPVQEAFTASLGSIPERTNSVPLQFQHGV